MKVTSEVETDELLKLRKRDGFAGQKMFVLPYKVITRTKSLPFFNSLYITDVGFFPRASHHYREREEGVDQHILIYCTEGRGWYEINRKRTDVGPDDFFIIPAGEAHRYGADLEDPWSIYWVHFSGSKADELNSKQLQFSQPIHHPVFHIDERIAIFEEIFQTLERGFSTENIGYSNSCLWHLLGTFLFSDAFKGNKIVEADDPIKISIEWMKKNLQQSVKLEELARHVHFSVSYYSALFQEKTGYSPIDYFIHLKMQRACQYLDLTNLKIKQIAPELGYQDPYYFSRLFHKVIGYFPSDYRRKQKG